MGERGREGESHCVAHTKWLGLEPHHTWLKLGLTTPEVREETEGLESWYSQEPFRLLVPNCLFFQL